MNDLISIIVPAYNAQSHIGKCIESIIDQTYKNLEIIIINDGSVDSTLSICKKYEKQDGRIVLINQENRGVSYCRNEGVKRATGEFVVFVDSDDYIDYKMIETLYKVQCEKNADIVQCGYYVLDDKEIFKKVVHSYIEGEKEQLMCFYINNLELCVVPWNKIIRREKVQEVPFPLNRRYEDEAIMYKLFYDAGTVINIESPLYYYYQNQTGFMHSEEKNIRKIHDLIRAKEEMTLFISNKCDTLKENVLNEFLRILFIGNINALGCRLNDTEERRAYKWIREKLLEYYEEMKENEHIKNHTLLILRYFPLLLNIKIKLFAK